MVEPITMRWTRSLEVKLGRRPADIDETSNLESMQRGVVCPSPFGSAGFPRSVEFVFGPSPFGSAGFPMSVFFVFWSESLCLGGFP